MNKKKLLVVDGNALMHRAWHALPLFESGDGQVVNAVYGFMSILLRVIKEYQPEYVAGTFDFPAPTFRNKLYSEYKAGRIKKPQEFYDQFGLVKEVMEAMDIKVYEEKGFEADDIIGRIVKDKSLVTNNVESVIITGDMDTLQLVDNNTIVHGLKRGINDTIIYNQDMVKIKYEGLTPNQLIDFKALRGDPSDNIKGAKGIGKKTGFKLIKDFYSIENLYKELENNGTKFEEYRERIKNILKEYKENVLLSKKLVTIKVDMELDFVLAECDFNGGNSQEVFDLFQRFGFKSLLKRLPEAKPQPVLVQKGLFSTKKIIKEPVLSEQTLNDKKEQQYFLINTEKELLELAETIKQQPGFAFDTETTGLDPFIVDLVGISFSFKEKTGYYVHFGKGSELKEYLFDEEKKKVLKEMLENPNQEKYAHNFKFDKKILLQYGINVTPVTFDTMIASYLINSEGVSHSLDSLTFRELGYEKISINSVVGKDYSMFGEIEGGKIYQYASEDADFCFRLVNKLKPKLKELNQEYLFHKIEMPLIEVLIEMELNGFELDCDYLEMLSKKYNSKIKELYQKICELAGEQFNISSPKQLQEILFTKLKIPIQGIKRTKTGYSTNVDTLQHITNLHPIVPLISEYRELSKLVSTYIDALPKLINKKTCRLHTYFNQTIAATGRLSSSNPNIQNIPIRTKLGKEIRKAFIVKKGYKLLSLDYSQIELRVIASLAGDESMIESFKNNEDIHQRTASLINNVSLEEVTKEMRYAGKAINFGVIYGQGPRGLAASSGLSYKEAKEFIDKYFEIRPKIKSYLDNIKELCRKVGYAETLFGRRRYIPNINSESALIRLAAERISVNMPVQGTAAGLIKVAMRQVYDLIKKEYKENEVKIIAQVHDELDFEVKEEIAEKFALQIKTIMENPELIKLDVPIKVDVEIGDNWSELEEL